MCDEKSSERALLRPYLGIFHILGWSNKMSYNRTERRLANELYGLFEKGRQANIRRKASERSFKTVQMLREIRVHQLAYSLGLKYKGWKIWKRS